MTWKITKDFIKDVGSKEGTLLNAVGVMGPSGCKFLEDKDMPARFRLYDDDGELYYEGITDVDLDKSPEEDVFAPLDDFGAPNAGATTIQYLIDGRWTQV